MRETKGLDLPAHRTGAAPWRATPRVAVGLGAASVLAFVVALLLPSWAGAARLLLHGLSVLGAAGLVGVIMLGARRLEVLGSQVQQAHQRQREALDAIGSGVVLWGPDDRLLFVNAEYRRLYAPLAHLLKQGMRFEDLLRAAVGQGLVPESAGREARWLSERLATHRSAAGAPMLLQLPPGQWRRVIEQRLPDGGVLGHSIDVTDLVLKEQALRVAQHDAREANARLVDAIETLPDAFALFDADDRLAVFNRRYADVYRESAAGVNVGTSFEEVLRHGLEQGQFPQALGREAQWLSEQLQAHHEPGPPLLQELPGNRWMRIVERPTRDGGRAGVRVDVTELVHREQELRQLNRRLDVANAELARLSDTDALTGLANRRQFDRRLAEEWSRAQRHGLSLALLIFDIDHFKRYNDRHGHLAGDRCLRDVAMLLRESARRPVDLVVRLGGEEFAMLLPQEDAASAMAQAQRCLRALEAAALEHGDSPVAPIVTLSIGGAHASGALGRDQEPTVLVAAADAALYAAKQGGRNRAVIAS